MTEEPKIHGHESLPFYAAYRALENRLINLSYVEFGLLVFGGDIRIFEMRPNKEDEFCQLSGRDQLSEVGIADSVSNEATPLESTLTRFRYAKTDVEELTPDYRYIPFDNACVEIAAFSDKSKNEIKRYLIDGAHRKHICPHHPYYGFVQPERDYLWFNSAYSEYDIDKILSDEFNASEYDIAFDVGNYLGELKNNGESADEVKRIKNILNRRVSRHADVVIRQNAIAELMALRPSFRDANIDEYKKTSSDLVGELISLPVIPSLEDRSLRYVWLNILIQRKTFVDGCPSGSERTIELGQLNKTIDEITRQLGCLVQEEIGNSKGIIEADNQQVNIDTGVFDHTVKPRQGGYKVRDELAIELVRDNPELLELRPGQIKARLEAASNLFLSGYTDWWRNNPIFKKGAPGRNPK